MVKDYFTSVLSRKFKQVKELKHILPSVLSAKISLPQVRFVLLLSSMSFQDQTLEQEEKHKFCHEGIDTVENWSKLIEKIDKRKKIYCTEKNKFSLWEYVDFIVLL